MEQSGQFAARVTRQFRWELVFLLLIAVLGVVTFLRARQNRANIESFQNNAYNIQQSLDELKQEIVTQEKTIDSLRREVLDRAEDSL